MASVAPAAGNTVWGVLYRMTDVDFAGLDKREGHYPDRHPSESRYLRATVTVTQGETGALEAVTYRANPAPEPGLPSPDYMAHMIAGALHHRFPENYVAMLRAQPTTDQA